MKDDNSGLCVLLAVLPCIGAWLTHIVHCLMHAKYLLLLAGGVIAPIGVIHGFGLWLGVAW
tara:strand:+ start:457 stop:639 length:183 start_codon:yes stop_codon:yes gene_type:complete